ncbi:hypothetical protein [Parabacteroides sp. FAFU027]|uniref:hypothetical protein n=1 Tax=Parabacteroides sp. FAFU027 TaxID=2922715 RepID=UPI001FAE7F78|nr:hypothetical protein [Parabacteroides sp. FAFU027]
MRLFDNEERRSQFLEEFKKVDKFYNTFKEEFETEIINIIRLHYPAFIRTDEFNELLSQFAIAALSITHTVLDKDESYPDFRKTEDLAALRAYYAKAIQTTKNIELTEQIHLKTKELAVKYYPKIVDLSGDGFRLLELNLKLFNLEFVATINSLI